MTRQETGGGPIVKFKEGLKRSSLRKASMRT